MLAKGHLSFFKSTKCADTDKRIIAISKDFFFKLTLFKETTDQERYIILLLSCLKRKINPYNNNGVIKLGTFPECVFSYLLLGSRD